MTNVNVSSSIPRRSVVQRLHEDLIGPRDPAESLKARPSDVWLTGILWPSNTELPPEDDERLAVAGDGESTGEDTDDQARPAGIAMRRPSAAGLSFAARGTGVGDPEIIVRISFGIYHRDETNPEDRRWVRTAKVLEGIRVSLALKSKDKPLGVPELPGLRLNIRAADFPGGRLATVTLVNGCQMEEPDRNTSEALTVFQVAMELTPADGTVFIARPSRRATVDDEDASAALLYRHAREYAAGHTCSADWTVLGSGKSAVVESLRISWLPEEETPAVSSAGHALFRDIGKSGSKPLSASWLSSAPAAAGASALYEVCDAYEKWIALQEKERTSLDVDQTKVADRHLDKAKDVLKRMRNGVARLTTDADAMLAFRLANLAMHTQSIWKEGGVPFEWRPFQLGELSRNLGDDV